MLLEEIQKEISDQEKFIKEQNQKVVQAEEHLDQLKDKFEVLRVAENMIPTIQEQMGGERDMMDNEAYALIDENPNGYGVINIR